MSMLLEQFETVFDTPESVKKLEGLIMDMAIRGKLVPQDSNDEPASMLLEKIKQDKELLIQEKKLKKEKPLSQITDEEKPYEIPRGWEWGRLGELGNIFNGNSINEKIKQEKYSKVTQGYDYIATKDIDSQTKAIRYDNGIKIPVHEDKFRIAHKGSVLICAEGGSAGKKVGILSKDVCFGNKLFAIEPYEGINGKYIFFLYQSSFFYKWFSLRMTGIIGGISIAKFKAIPVPIPPLNEQQRIVETVEHLMRFCGELKEQLEKKQRRKNRLNISSFFSLTHSETEEELRKNLQFVLSYFNYLCTDKKHVQQLRNAILSLAIQGKLVQQDENDEPASVLLEKIKQEKERLVKEKKIKKAKILPEITDEEKPFDLPNRWEWVRLGELGTVQGGATPSKGNSSFWTGTIPWISPKDMKKKYTIGSIDKISEDALMKTSSLKLISPNSLLFVVRGMILAHSFPVSINKIAVCTNQDMKSLTPYDESIINFLYYAILAEKGRILKLIERSTHGTCRLETDKLLCTLIPIPPLNEQQRIVEKVEQLMALCDELEKGIEQSKQESENLMKAMLQEVFVIKEEMLN